MTWLVTGGAGYIGSHTVRQLLLAGHQVVVLDDLSTGYADRVPAGVPLVVAAVHDQAAVASTMRAHSVCGVVHLAARKSVVESVARPDYYHTQNVGGLASVVAAMAQTGVTRIVFSSSAAVYGTPTQPRVREGSPTRPASPYGQTKLLGELLLRAAARDVGLSFVALRYFNVAGAAAPALADPTAVNLIPLAFKALRTGEALTVTGVDYPTRDGSGVRDYVHVDDVARAHAASVGRLSDGGAMTEVYNVGTGCGYSVLEVLAGIAAVTGSAVPYQTGERRPGDCAEVVADVRRIGRQLGWSAQHDLTDMLASSWSALRTLAAVPA